MVQQQSTTKQCAYFIEYTVCRSQWTNVGLRTICGPTKSTLWDLWPIQWYGVKPLSHNPQHISSIYVTLVGKQVYECVYIHATLLMVQLEWNPLPLPPQEHIVASIKYLHISSCVLHQMAMYQAWVVNSLNSNDFYTLVELIMEPSSLKNLCFQFGLLIDLGI